MNEDLFNIEIPTSENVPMCIGDVKHPRWTYAMTKMHGESAFIHSASKHNYDCVVIRYQNIIGPEMGFGHAIPHIVERFINKIESPIKIYGHNQTRAFCYIDDAVNGTIKAMESSKANGEIYHIGNDQEISMKELTQFIGEILEYTGKYENAITYPGSVHRRCPDITKAEKDLLASLNANPDQASAAGRARGSAGGPRRAHATVLGPRARRAAQVRRDQGGAARWRPRDPGEVIRTPAPLGFCLS